MPSLFAYRESLTGEIGHRCYYRWYGVISLVLQFWLVAAANPAPYTEL